jgi:3-oxoacyl-[acyl-carrier-protein] synthase-3
MHKMYSNVIITGTGSYVPKNIITNNDFASNKFYDSKKSPIDASHNEIVKKFTSITGIVERRYAYDNQVASDIGSIAAKIAIEDARIDPETIDQIIVAHNYGDIKKGTTQMDAVPSIATRIKHNLQIKNPSSVAYDLLFGCPGWLQGIIQAKAYIKAGMAKKCLVISTETLSRVIDENDRDSMIYADGAGACIIEGVESETEEGVITTISATHAKDEAYYLYFDKSNNPSNTSPTRYLKMHGRKIYEFALTNVPTAMKTCLDESGFGIHDVKKIFIHQANEKMDDEIIKRFYRLYKEKNIPKNVTPMSIHMYGNSSVATIPTLLDLVRKGQYKGVHELNKGDIILFTSVGAGMNLNAITYKV